MSPRSILSVRSRTRDFEIQALVDGQLGWDAQKRFWKEIEDDPTLQRRYDQLVAQKRALLQWWSSEGGARRPISSLKDESGTVTV
ncbi:MAG: hypothetical protein EPN97_03525 [Alphaproteobacteria bacterium]|nr:MAG: hypothetical protein EPN97_03525 [Alphaproteobacteria bacterium]